MRVTTEIKIKEGWKIEDFAPWYYLKDKWREKGDFSIPAVRNKAIYGKERKKYEERTTTGTAYH